MSIGDLDCMKKKICERIEWCMKKRAKEVEEEKEKEKTLPVNKISRSDQQLLAGLECDKRRQLLNLTVEKVQCVKPKLSKKDLRAALLLRKLEVVKGDNGGYANVLELKTQLIEHLQSTSVEMNQSVEKDNGQEGDTKTVGVKWNQIYDEKQPKSKVWKGKKLSWLSQEEKLKKCFDIEANNGSINQDSLLKLLKKLRLEMVQSFNTETQKITDTLVDVVAIIDEFGIKDLGVLTFDQLKEYKQTRKKAVYPKQEEMAHKLFQCIETSCNLQNFTDFEMIIIVPDLNTLLRQTVARLREFFDDYAPHFRTGFFQKYCTDISNLGNNEQEQHNAFVLLPEAAKLVRWAAAEKKIERDLVYKKVTNIREHDLKRYSALQKKIADKKHCDTLFLLIHDEAHYGSTYKGAADVILHGDAQKQLQDLRAHKLNVADSKKAKGVPTKTHYKRADLLPGGVRLAALPNVIVLNVTATPFNLISQQTQIPAANEVKWEDAPGYYGQENYTSSNMQDAGVTERGSLNSTARDYGDAFNKSVLKLMEDEYKPNPEMCARVREMCARVHTLTQQYVSALRDVNNVGRFTKAEPLNVTETMVRDLIEEPFTSEDGSGIMIVIRQPDTLGAQIGNSLRKVRDQLGLQHRFAVVVDIEMSGERGGIGTAMELHNEEMLDVMVQRSGLTKDLFLGQLSSYEDLDGLPVVLILCEKGKMGDSFPPSFRYYDLRIRYPTVPTARSAIVQDLGRAFGYKTQAEAPVIFVGQGCMEALEKPAGIVGIDPDYTTKMKRIGKIEKHKYPKKEFDLDPYRKYWQAGEHNMDYHSHPDNTESCKNWCNSPQNFLLFGRPQIGKTGAFLHLTFLLFRHIRGEPVDVEGLDMVDPSDSEDAEDEHNMAAWPNFSVMEQLPFIDSAKAGKYGNPMDPETWTWYVKDHKLPPAPNAAKFSTAAAATAQPQMLEAAASRSGAAAKMHNQCTNSKAATKTSNFVNSKWHARKFEMDCWSRGYDELFVADPEKDAVKYKLWVPKKDPRTDVIPKDFWFALNGLKILSFKLRVGECDTLPIPIFMPSAGRHGQDGTASGLLDLSGMIRQKNYLQIVVVKQKEVEAYKRHICGRAIILELPDSVLGCVCPRVAPGSQGCFGVKNGCDEGDLGIGCSRYHIQKLAQALLPQAGARECSFVFVMDDSTLCFKGLALKKDNEHLPDPRDAEDSRYHTMAPFGRKPDPPARYGNLTSVGKFVSTSIGDVLAHFLDTDRRDAMDQFGAIGFYRFNGTTTFNAAYSRQNIYSAVLWNVRVLKDKQLNFDPKVHVWEDIDFNRRASEKGVVLCKCNRFQQLKVQVRSGGCSDGVARDEAAESEKSMEEPAAALEPAAVPSDILAEPASLVNAVPARAAEETPAEEPSDTDGLQKMLRHLSLDKYLERLKSEDMDCDTLKTYMDKWGEGKLQHYLKEAGVDTLGARMKIVNYLDKYTVH